MEMRGLMGGLYRFTEWVMRLSVANLLWLITSAPVFYLLLVMLFSPVEWTIEQIQFNYLLMAVVSPFTLVPSTAAVFSMARKWIMGDVDIPLFKSFFKGYKSNYRQSMLGGIFFLLLGSLILLNYNFYAVMEGALQYIAVFFISFGMVMAVSFFNFLSLTVHFEMKFFQLIKNAFLLTLLQPMTSLGLLFSNIVIIMLSMRVTFLIPFFVCSFIAIVSFWFFYQGFNRLEAKGKLRRQLEGEGEEAAANPDNRADDRMEP